MMKERRSRDLNGSCQKVSLEDAKSFEELALRELRQTGYRITMPRVQVIRALADSNKALSAYAIHEKIVSSGGKIDVVSVYRILATLQEVGLIHHIGVVDGYFPCRMEGSHAGKSEHLVCDGCGCVTELKLPLNIVELTNDQADKAAFQPLGIKLEVIGKCSHCQEAS
jgi:Fur family transcriptional regulator, zinc uptake regulator